MPRGARHYLSTSERRVFRAKGPFGGTRAKGGAGPRVRGISLVIAAGLCEDGEVFAERRAVNVFLLA
jgi:hypothetical protein